MCDFGAAMEKGVKNWHWQDFCQGMWTITVVVLWQGLIRKIFWLVIKSCIQGLFYSKNTKQLSGCCEACSRWGVNVCHHPDHPDHPVTVSCASSAWSIKHTCEAVKLPMPVVAGSLSIKPLGSLSQQAIILQGGRYCEKFSRNSACLCQEWLVFILYSSWEGMDYRLKDVYHLSVGKLLFQEKTSSGTWISWEKAWNFGIIWMLSLGSFQ